jgi:hypothetical protein
MISIQMTNVENSPEYYFKVSKQMFCRKWFQEKASDFRPVCRKNPLKINADIFRDP